MPKRTTAISFDDEAEQKARAAWLHFVGGLTQGEVAKRLMVPVTRAHRYIARAQSEGLVRISVDVSSAACIEIEMQLSAQYGLSLCRVAMDVPEQDTLPLRTLGAAGGNFLLQAVSAGGHETIGIGHGRTIHAVVDAVGRTDMSGIRFVSMLGGLTRSYTANPYDVIHTLAQRGGAYSYFMPAPMFTDSADDKRVMMAQSGIVQTMDLIAGTTLAIVGIGELDETSGASMVAALESPEAVLALKDRGARAEILGQFIDADGAVMDTEYDARVMAPALESLRGRDIVAIAGGAGKTEAILAALRSGLLTGLIVDETTARTLVADGGEDKVAVA